MITPGRVFIVLALSFLLLNCSGPATSKDMSEGRPKPDMQALRARAAWALAFCKEKKLNTAWCILVNAGLHSGLDRFYLWSFTADTFIRAFPVSHGCGENSWNDDESKTNPCFSNVDGSHCTSLGRYRLGERGVSSWGIRVKYLMYGLEQSNSNALARQIVFHSWENVPDSEVYPRGTPEGWGCPAVSNNNMRYMDSLLRTQKVPLLMWIYQ